MRGRRFIVQLHGPLISALDRGDAQFQSRLIRVRGYLFERLTPRQDFRNGLGIHQKGPDLLHAGIERIGAIHFHRAHPPVEQTTHTPESLVAEGGWLRHGWSPLMAREARDPWVDSHPPPRALYTAMRVRAVRVSLSARRSSAIKRVRSASSTVRKSETPN